MIVLLLFHYHVFCAGLTFLLTFVLIFTFVLLFYFEAPIVPLVAHF